ncbi:hypothetical protein HUG15_17185 [Salicibibacter cibarius]|uniref:Tetratricopeptide repeat protein n=1 Tax=Salicibibacter cibarius TaxID=2743000 RepID=A0A7T6Z591_9BACI|nr:hypothetical protein [Salicibibacter cibarius]QQK77139.1 hypothetical protein HUG15_17185 [Salicibibacter cibarius]
MDDKNNVVLFPGSIRLLLNEGLNALKAGDFEQGLKHFNQTLMFDERDEQACYGRLVCLLELGYLEDSKTIAADMLHEGIGGYEDVLYFYVSALVQLGEWDAVVDTIETERQSSRLPAKYAEHFFQFLATARTMKKEAFLPEAEEEDEDYSAVLRDETLAGLFDPSPEVQWRTFQQLKKRSWRQVKAAFETALRHENTSPMIKTLLLLVMKDWEVGASIKVSKYKREKNVIPVQLNSFSEYEAELKTSIFEQWEDGLAQDNPMLYETAQSILEWIFMEYYPFPLPEATVNVWAAAIHVESLRYMGIQDEVEKVEMLYDADHTEVEKLVNNVVSSHASFHSSPID